MKSWHLESLDWIGNQHIPVSCFFMSPCNIFFGNSFVH